MRKMLNKKGFSLVELMIVVVIMGILIAVAIPLYGAITDNAKNKTCKNNIQAIKQNAANYYASYDATANQAAIAAMFDDGNIPQCPWNNASYTVEVAANGAATVHHAAGADECGNLTDAPYAG